MSFTPPPDEHPVTLTWITASIEHHEHTVPFGLLRTYLDHARKRAGRPDHPDYTRDLDLLKDTWLGVHESEILDYRHIRRITGHDLPPFPRPGRHEQRASLDGLDRAGTEDGVPKAPELPVFTVTVAGSERHDGEAGYTYAVCAPDLEAAGELTVGYHGAQYEDDDVIVVVGPWETFAGAPSWPRDLPGRAWSDLRGDGKLLERARRMRAVR